MTRLRSRLPAGSLVTVPILLVEMVPLLETLFPTLRMFPDPVEKLPRVPVVLIGLALQNIQVMGLVRTLLTLGRLRPPRVTPIRPPPQIPTLVLYL